MPKIIGREQRRAEKRSEYLNTQIEEPVTPKDSQKDLESQNSGKGNDPKEPISALTTDLAVENLKRIIK